MVLECVSHRDGASRWSFVRASPDAEIGASFRSRYRERSFFVAPDQRHFVVDDTPGDGQAVGNGFTLPPMWIDQDGTVHDDVPECLQEGRRVTVGVVRTEATDIAPGTEIAAWPICR